LYVSNRRQLIAAHREEILRIVHENRGRRAYLFGSVARGEDDDSSDIDLLTVLLGVSVDVVSAGGLLDRDEHIRREAVPM
jgi:predicted nucleotidyltransferase